MWAVPCLQLMDVAEQHAGILCLYCTTLYCIILIFVIAVFEISVEEGEKLVRPTDFMKYVHENDERVLDRELDREFFEQW